MKSGKGEQYKLLSAFIDNYANQGGVPLWSEKHIFNSNDSETPMGDDPGPNIIGCIPNEDNNFVCDEDEKKNPEYHPHKNMLRMAILHSTLNKFFNGKFKCLCDNMNSSRNVFARIEYMVNDSYWNPKFGYSNLANKYVRFDHTNKTLYENGKPNEVGTGTFFPGCTNVKNYYNGSGWTHSSFYGLVTPFEVQRFTYNRDDDCPVNNPLQFSDENYGTQTRSKYQFEFLNDKEPEQSGKKVEFIATAVGYYYGYPIVERNITSNDGVRSLTKLGYSGWFDPAIDVYVTARVKANDAVVQNSAVSVEYPYKGKYKPDSDVKIENDGLCQIDNPSIIRSVDDQNNHCFMYYPAASRIHYGINDWTDSEWGLYFGSPNDMSYINNPIYAADTKDPLSVDSLFGDLDSLWLGDEKSIIYDKYSIQSNEFGENSWVIKRDKIAKENEMQSKVGAVQLSALSELVLAQESIDNGWRIEKNDDGSVKSVYNEGDVVSANISYVRAADDILLDDDHLKPYAKETIHRDQLAKQYHGSSKIVAEDEWVQNFMLSNAKIFNRKDSTEHKYFSVSVSQNKEDLDVSRNGLVPQERVEEIATLRGQVPKNGTRWTLSFLSGNRMIPIASGVQQGRVSSAPYPLLSKIDVDTLQGNTSFFLTYGLDDAAGDIYFKQLDVHIGHLLKPTEKSVISSMYGNVSVLFPENAFDTDVDVTARVVSLSDYPAYDVFQGINPVGTIVEVLPSHVFKKDSSTWPRVSIEVTKESVGGQNPLDVRIYKPDTKLKKIVPLEEQELSFYNALDKMLFTCGDSSDVACVANLVPSGWAKIRVSGKTPTFSTFMLMDKDEAANVKVVEDKEVVTEFSCNFERLSNDTVVWAGLINGSLAYPYPCVGESSYMLQLLYNNDAVYEKQGVAKTSIELPYVKTISQ